MGSEMCIRDRLRPAPPLECILKMERPKTMVFDLEVLEKVVKTLKEARKAKGFKRNTLNSTPNGRVYIDYNPDNTQPVKLTIEGVEDLEVFACPMLQP